MELKYLVILSVLGVAAGFTIPTQEQNAPEPRDIPSLLDLEASLLKDSLDADPSSEAARAKRCLITKFLKKLSQGETVYVDRRYESSGDGYRPGREVHHHSHTYNYVQPSQPSYSYQPYPAPNQQYHHYHGYQQQQQGQGYYAGGATTQQNYYSNGGYAQYGGHNAPALPPLPPQQQTPINAAPLSSGRNTVDRGQGAAAVNNIAIIHTKAGSSIHNLTTSESKLLPHPLPADIANFLNKGT